VQGAVVAEGIEDDNVLGFVEHAHDRLDELLGRRERVLHGVFTDGCLGRHGRGEHAPESRSGRRG
jgi:hypothetical protein